MILQILNELVHGAVHPADLIRPEHVISRNQMIRQHQYHHFDSVIRLTRSNQQVRGIMDANLPPPSDADAAAACCRRMLPPDAERQCDIHTHTHIDAN